MQELIKVLRTNAKNEDFKSLVKLLDADLAVKDGEDHEFYDQFNKLDAIKYSVVLYEGETPVACGAIKKFNEELVEIKRMFTLPEKRGKGLATQVMKELENWAKELGFEKCILETGKKQVEALSLYPKNGYKIRENYGPYLGVENSICFEKELKKD